MGPEDTAGKGVWDDDEEWVPPRQDHPRDGNSTCKSLMKVWKLKPVLAGGLDCCQTHPLQIKVFTRALSTSGTQETSGAKQQMVFMNLCVCVTGDRIQNQGVRHDKPVLYSEAQAKSCVSIS